MGNVRPPERGVLLVGVLAAGAAVLAEAEAALAARWGAVDLRSATWPFDFTRYYEANLAFHDVYLTRHDNTRLVALVHLLKQRLYDWPRRDAMVQAWEQHSVVEHEDFLQRLERGAVNEAAAHLQDVHWSFTVQERFIHAYYFASPPPEA